ncbi:zinc-dependent alcohol dehydrogenase [Clostridium beijerinckii]|jgi:threonine dehydrogenase-like Zn-dependent dehydrogenase|uniref:Alcohol dehydrogenase catalytic domain-containing protein n=2 Tax=Clostridium beijerinckii TaxID=1520 RepID=A0A1S8QH95_CLOBE|nr:alcohol dehydrogenase catalytic domain-containing protein [Clostridium beijerinckii]ABR36004.1 Alcohol dehydrogenase GroES domain protein [Clostridium beijerinckii NCIMB 8052]AIU01721.1 alcohol dehydrogenase [Clostridium beijerinckii ATCC 35702]MBF7809355.1 alcohol dehydrogenase catalytic domain-containing protein [Clostridium beijerinckii]NOW89888.1 threonine dehydrogenase-like Zn-dependent dehydrogenase [Clostridium beijerinckii]NRT22950.1 threonine dehydrogenase-like Zn-dependent dehydro
MRALKYNGTWDVSLEEVDDLHIINPNDVIVDIKYCGICGTDVGIIAGTYPVAVKGVTLGHESTGIIAEVGSEVKNVKVGDRVVINPTYYCGKCRMCQTLRINHCENKFGTESGVSYDGTYADRYRTTSDFVYKIPDGVSMKAVTLTEPLSCVITGARKIQPSSMNLNTYVFGAGTMGILYTWALHLKGLTPVVIETSLNRLNYASDCVPQGVNIYSSLEEARTNYFNDPKAPLDIVVDTTSGLLEKLYPEMSCDGTYMSIGLKDKYANINVRELADKSLSIIGSIDSLHGSFLDAFHLITKNIIPAEKLVSHVIPLENYKKAFSILGCDIDSKSMVQPKEKNAKVIIEC